MGERGPRSPGRRKVLRIVRSVTGADRSGPRRFVNPTISTIRGADIPACTGVAMVSRSTVRMTAAPVTTAPVVAASVAAAGERVGGDSGTSDSQGGD
jgi:hypothetical protein